MTAGAKTRSNIRANALAADHPLWQTELAGTNLIEASAGTGKTWTITGLYLRLIVESRLEPRQLLAVTFTNAATAELKERIRAKLVALRERLISGTSSDDPLIEPMALRVDDKLATAARLRNAIESFDEAVICTIHSFCQRLLGEQAFESALPFDTELLVDDGAIRDEVAQDWWRNEMADAGPIWARYLMDMHCSPASFLAEARTLLQPGIEKVLLPILEPWDEGAWQRAYVQARTIWRAERVRIEQLILDAPLHGNRYRAAHILDWCVQLDEYFGSEIPSVLQPGGKEPVLVRFTQTRIDQSTTKGQPAVTHPFFVAAEALVDTLELAESALQCRLAIAIR